MAEPRSSRAPRPSRRDVMRGRFAPTSDSGRHDAEIRRALMARPAAMRHPDRQFASALQKSVPPPPPARVIALNRMAFGPRPGDLDAFQALGANDTARMTAYVDQQLDPSSIDNTDLDNRMAAAGFITLNKSAAQLWADHVVPDPPWEERMRPFFEVENATFLRAVYSRSQLEEVLTEFWHNHFSIFGFEFTIGPTWAYYDRAVIRANVLGNFRSMLGLVAKSPAMLYYLDNRVNSFDGPNENYARELIELHCMGAAAFLGSVPQSEVPLDGQGRPIGYVDEDVTAAARCLTGWTLSDRPWDPAFGNTGEFLYHDPWHDHDPKTFLGVDLPANQAPLQDGEVLLDLLAEHPATARFIATKLCRRLIGDTPPPTVIDAAASVFAAQTSAPDQLAQVVRTILLAPEFLTTWGDKIKRPFELVTSALRGGNVDWDFSFDNPQTDTLFYRFHQTGHGLFRWHPPNGYPDFKGAWRSTAPMVMAWKAANWLSDVQDENEAFLLDAFSQTPPEIRSANALTDYWLDRILGWPIDARERTELVEFMAQGFNPNFDLPLDSDNQTQERLRALVGLIFMSPSFLWR